MDARALQLASVLTIHTRPEGGSLQLRGHKMRPKTKGVQKSSVLYSRPSSGRIPELESFEVVAIVPPILSEQAVGACHDVQAIRDPIMRHFPMVSYGWEK